MWYGSININFGLIKLIKHKHVKVCYNLKRNRIEYEKDKETMNVCDN